MGTEISQLLWYRWDGDINWRLREKREDCTENKIEIEIGIRKVGKEERVSGNGIARARR